MSALHDAARIVVAAWVSDRRTWVEECNQAVLALDAALKAQACKCNLRTRLVGDGCEVCNPKLAAELAQQAEPVRSQQMADAGFTRRPSLWALQAREALELIAAPKHPDGTWNRDREACRQLAAEALGRYDDE